MQYNYTCEASAAVLVLLFLHRRSHCIVSASLIKSFKLLPSLVLEGNVLQELLAKCCDLICDILEIENGTLG